MQYVRMGSTGAKVSRLCLGCMSFGAGGGGGDWTIGEADSMAVVRKAIESGINFFDTADIYSHGRSEEILGRSLKALNVPRDEMVIATKVALPPIAADSRVSILCSRLTPAWSDWAWIMSISTKSTASIMTRRSRRPSKRLMMS